MTTTLTPAIVTETVLDSLIQYGDVEKLTPDQRTDFYRGMCQQLDLNIMTKPFDLIRLNGKMVLYANRNCTDQLRNKRNISIRIVARDMHDDVYVVTAEATRPSSSHPDGFVTDSSIGAVPITGLRGEALANAQMKAETKAKRRVTLSITGLSLLDETEAVTIPETRFAELDVNTGEITETAPPLSWDEALRQRDPQVPPAPPFQAAPPQQQSMANSKQLIDPTTGLPFPFLDDKNRFTITLEGPLQRTLMFKTSKFSYGLLDNTDRPTMMFPADYVPSFMHDYLGMNENDHASMWRWMEENLARFGYDRGTRSAFQTFGGSSGSNGAIDPALGYAIIKGFFDIVQNQEAS